MSDGSTKPAFSRHPIGMGRDKRLTAQNVVALSVICDHMDHNNECYPSDARLARELGISERSVRRHKKDLVTAGYITVTKRGPHPEKIRVNLEAAPPESRDHVAAKQDNSPDDKERPDVACPVIDENTGHDVTGLSEKTGHGVSGLAGKSGHVMTGQGDLGNGKSGHAATGLDQKSGHAVTKRAVMPRPEEPDIEPDRGGRARARAHTPAREPDPQAQPPPVQIADQGKSDGSDASAQVPVPEVLPEDWRSVAVNEFHDVHELARRFSRFSNHYAGDKMTAEKWLGRWRNWLLDDFEPVNDNLSSPTNTRRASASNTAINRPDPPIRPERLDEFCRLMKVRYCAEAKRNPGNLRLNARGQVFREDEAALMAMARQTGVGSTDPPFGLQGGPMWDWPTIYERLKGFGGFARRCPPKMPAGRSEGQRAEKVA